MTDVDDLALNAVRLVSRHLESGEVALEPGRSGTNAAVVSGPTSEWWVRLLDVDAAAHAAGRLRVYDAAPPFLSDTSAGKTDGIALLGDGASFHLNRPAEFSEFFRHARMDLTPIGLARLLALYQQVNRSERVVEHPDEVMRLTGGTWPEQLATVEPPTIDGNLSGSFSMSFYSMLVGRDERGRRSLDVTRWEVTAGSNGDLTWSSRSLLRARPVAASAEREGRC